MSIFHKILRENKPFKEIYPDFLADRKIALSGSSYRNYVSKFNIISAWMRARAFDELPIWKITDEMVSSFFTYLAIDRGLDKPTCQKYFIDFRGLFNWALKRDYVDKIPFNLITFPNKKRDMGAKLIEQDDLKKLLTSIQIKDKQLYLVIMCEYYCALRPGREIRLMRIDEVDLVTGVIRIPPDRAKSRRREVVTMPEQLIVLFKDYLNGYTDKTMYVFGNKGVPGYASWSENMLGYRFNKYRDGLELSKDIKLYSSKHTGLTRLANSGAPMHVIMEHARHTSLAITQKYIKKHAGIVNDRIKYNFPNPIEV